MQAIGFPANRYRCLLRDIGHDVRSSRRAARQQNTDFVSPASMYWTRSGDLMVMVILGGMGSLFVP